MDIWQDCINKTSHQQLQGQLVRVVESQEQVATNHLVETLDEQQLLEQMLEANKPQLTQSEQPKKKQLHYLLATPFRYPPLKYGSRFGTKSEPSLLYGSKTLVTALTETAYYRMVFWRGMSSPPPSGKFITQHTAWGASYQTAKGMALQQAPFVEFQSQLAAPNSYQASQQLGAQLRQLGTEAFEFTSARDSNPEYDASNNTAHSPASAQRGINVALFTPTALTTRRPAFQQQWLCETQVDGVSFYSSGRREYHHFEQSQFLVNNKFPMPAVS